MTEGADNPETGSNTEVDYGADHDAATDAIIARIGGIDMGGEEPPVEGDSEESQDVEDTATDDEVSEEGQAEEDADSEDETDADESESDDETQDEEEPEPDEETDDTEVAFELEGEDGEVIKVNRDEAKLGYLRQQDYSRKMHMIGEKRSANEAHERQLAENMQTVMQVAEMFDPVLATVRQTDMNKLRSENPDEFNRLQVQLAERTQALQWLNENQTRIVQENAQQTMVQQQEKVPELIPEWHDPIVAREDATEIVSYLTDVGYTTDEISMGLVEARELVVAREAMLYRKQQKALKTAKAKKTPVRVTKGNKPKASAGKNTSTLTNKQKTLKQRALQSNDPDAQTEYILSKL